jgi:hypothetical protein
MRKNKWKKGLEEKKKITKVGRAGERTRDLFFVI